MSQTPTLLRRAVISPEHPTIAEPPTAAGGPERSAGERSSPARSGGPPAAVATTPAPVAPSSVSDSEVVPKPKRRYFTAAYKLDVLRRSDACTTSGAIGALLRREGLYSSSLTEWRRMRDKGFLDAAVARKRGRKPKPVDPLAKKLVEVERELAKTKEKLRKAEIIIDFQKKVQDLLRMQEESEKK